MKSLGLPATCPGRVLPLSAYAYQRSVSLLLAEIHLRTTPAHKAALQAKADRAGLSLTDYLLGQRRARNAAALPSGADPVLMARILGELGKWGGNWNQLARDRNMTGREPEADELRLIRRALTDMRDMLVKALSP